MILEAFTGGRVRSGIALPISFANTPQSSFLTGEVGGDPPEFGGGATPQREDLPGHFPYVAIALGETPSKELKEGAIGDLAIHDEEAKMREKQEGHDGSPSLGPVN